MWTRVLVGDNCFCRSWFNFCPYVNKWGFLRYKKLLSFFFFGLGETMYIEWEFCKACEVKELKPNCSRNVLNINDHTVAVSNQERDGERLAVLQSPMKTDYYAAHVLLRKPSGSRIKVRNVHSCIWCIMWSSITHILSSWKIVFCFHCFLCLNIKHWLYYMSHSFYK